MAERQINGRTFRVEPMLATKALVMQARVARVAGPWMGRFATVIRGGGNGERSQSDKDAALQAAMQALSSVFADVDPIEIADLVKDVCECADIKRPSGYDKLDFDGDMTGHSPDVIPLVMFVLGEQFSDFLAGMGAVGGQKIRAVR